MTTNNTTQTIPSQFGFPAPNIGVVPASQTTSQSLITTIPTTTTTSLPYTYTYTPSYNTQIDTSRFDPVVIEINRILDEMTTKIAAFSTDKLKGIGTQLDRSFERYITLDKAHNILRESGFYDQFVVKQKSVWNEVVSKAGYKNYNSRDAIWDALIAEMLKNDLTAEEHMLLIRPYATTFLASSV